MSAVSDDTPVFWQRRLGWIRYACCCGYIYENIYSGCLSDNARRCDLCGAIVVGERFTLGDLNGRTKIR